MRPVCLVQMPYSALERPSLALGLLKASLERAGVGATVVYADLRFAETIGLDLYAGIESSPAVNLIGEWTFSAAAFPWFSPPRKDFLRWVLRGREEYFGKLLGRSRLRETLRQVREAASLFVNRLGQSILKLEPRVVGCTSTFQQHCASLALLRWIRERAPEVATMMGGGNCEGELGRACHREFTWVDFVVSGEAEELIGDLCLKILRDGVSIPAAELPAGVFGPCHRHEGFSGLRGSESRAVVRDLDALPPPDYSDYFSALGASPLAPYVRPGLPIETSRGCWWGQKQHCTFCGLNGAQMAFRAKSAQRALEEFQALSARHGVRGFLVVDNILDMRYFETLLAGLSRLDPPCELFYEVKANLSYEHLRRLAEAGVRWIQPGLESLHDDALQAMGKGTSASINVQLLRWALELGIHVFWNFLYGVPDEPDEWYAEMADWLPQVFHLQPPLYFSRIRFDRFSPYFTDAERFGLSPVPFESYSYVYPVPRERLHSLAYFFEDSRDSWAGRSMWGGPGLGRLRTQIERWRRLWAGRERPVLTVRDEGERAVIVDTRPFALQRVTVLQGVDYWVYHLCDAAVSTETLAEQVSGKAGREAAAEQVESVARRFERLKILRRFGRRWLRLAVREPCRPLPAHFPGGSVDLTCYRRPRLPRKDTPAWRQLAPG